MSTVIFRDRGRVLTGRAKTSTLCDVPVCVCVYAPGWDHADRVSNVAKPQEAAIPRGRVRVSSL